MMRQQWAIDREKALKAEVLWCVEGWQLARLVSIVEKLYLDRRLNGDEQRNMAQLISAVLDNCWPVLL